MRKVLAAAATVSVLALSLTACGSGGNLSGVKVTPAADDSTVPTVSFKTPFLTEDNAAETVIKGDGAEINEGDTISIKSGLYKAIDGQVTSENFSGDPTSMTVDDSFKESMPELFNLVVDSKVGDWIAYTAIDGAQQADGTYAEPLEGARAERIIVIEIEGSTPASAPLSKDEVSSLKKDGKLPTVKLDKDGTPTITIPEGVDAPQGLAVDVLEEGKGEVATEASTVKAKYLGVTYADGKEFDGNFDGDATEFSLSGVIKGWTQGLSGLKEGSKVMLTIPSSLAYGDTSTSGSPTGTLVFYVELTSVDNSAAPASE